MRLLDRSANDGIDAEARTVVILGCGLMGSQIGAEFTMSDYRVVFLVRDPIGARARLADTYDWAKRIGLLDSERAAVAIRLARFATDVAELPLRAVLLLECLPEDLVVKTEVLGRTARHVTSNVVGTNTASLSIAGIARSTDRPADVIGIHYWNPPLVMPLVEVVRGPETSDRVVEMTTQLLRDAGKTVVLLRREVPGFLWNRLQFAVLREALWLIDNGVAEMEDIDTVVRLGLARRWRDVGLFESIHLGGPENWERVAGNLFPALSRATDASGIASRVRIASLGWHDLIARRDSSVREAIRSDLHDDDVRRRPDGEPSLAPSSKADPRTE